MYHTIKLSSEDKETLKKGVSWITLLIAGADGKIEKEELEWAKKITDIRSYTIPDLLKEFYQEVGKDFTDVLNAELDQMPDDTDESTAMLTSKIEGLNAILAKMSNNEAFHFYKSFTTFAEHVAKATGGFLRFFSVSAEEKKLMNLPMLTPYVFEESQEEE